MRTRRSWRNQDRLYRSIGRELQQAARGQWLACGPVCKLHTRTDPAICGEGRAWLDHAPAARCGAESIEDPPYRCTLPAGHLGDHQQTDHPMLPTWRA